MILVCYLVAPGYEAAAEAFRNSYGLYPPGEDHDLVHVVKGETKIAFYSPPWCQGSWLERHPNRGMDICSLQRVCWDYAEYDWVVWFGSHCRIQSYDWLTKLYRNAMRPGVAAVAASGSYEAGISGVRPNPHLRTNCLMIAPSVLNSLECPPVDTREDCYHFEHGPDSLYRRLLARNFRALVVGRDGRGYTELEWPTSRTFRCDEQQNLLVADKHTDAYQAADPQERTVLRGMAWDL